MSDKFPTQILPQSKTLQLTEAFLQTLQQTKTLLQTQSLIMEASNRTLFLTPGIHSNRVFIASWYSFTKEATGRWWIWSLFRLLCQS